MESITSRDNRRIKEAARLGADRSFREEQGRFLLEGLRLCADVAATTGLAQTLFVTSRALERHGDALAALLPLCKEYFHITEEVAAKLSDTKSPQGVFCICARPEPPEGPSPGEQILLLERVSDPGNLGTILRTAEAFGVSRLIVSSDSADLYSPKALRASMGSAFRLRVQSTEDMGRTVEELAALGIPTWAAALGEGSLPLSAVPLAAPVAVVVGNEGSGVTEQTQSLCAGQLIIPMEGQIESLNVSVAAAVLLWEMKRQRGE